MAGDFERDRSGLRVTARRCKLFLRLLASAGPTYPFHPTTMPFSTKTLCLYLFFPILVYFHVSFVFFFRTACSISDGSPHDSDNCSVVIPCQISLLYILRPISFPYFSTNRRLSNIAVIIFTITYRTTPPTKICKSGGISCIVCIFISPYSYLLNKFLKTTLSCYLNTFQAKRVCFHFI